LSDAAQDIITERANTHGQLLHQATLAQGLAKLMRDEPGFRNLSPEQKQSAEMIALKLSRLIVGNPNEPDHWKDIAGYATLIHNLLTKGTHL
jgi:hypothetical protein